MPNWCYNYLEVKGPKEALKRFDEQFKKKHICYGGGAGSLSEDYIKEQANNWIAYRVVIKPDYFDKTKMRTEVNYINEQEEREGYSFSNFVELTKENYLNGWYDWSSKNWGTKWDACEVSADVQDDGLYYSFETAWSPCIPVVNEMAKQYPELDFLHKYEEDGEGYAGIMKYHESECIEELESDGDFREFMHEHFDREYYKCAACGHLIDEWELEEDKVCPNCDATAILDTDWKTPLVVKPKEE